MLIVLVLKARITDGWLYDGGLIGVGLCSAVLIGGVVHGGALSRALGAPTLAALGRISYGLYLFHWPLFLVLSEERLGFGGIALFVVRVGVSLAAALASFRLLEQPIRHRRRLVLPRQAGLAAAITLAVLAGSGARRRAVAELHRDRGVARAGRHGGGDRAHAGPRARPIPTTRPSPTHGDGARNRGGHGRRRHGRASDTAATGSAPGDVPATDISAPVTTVETTATTAPPPPRVLLVGNDESPLAALTARGYDVIDGLQRNCPVASAAAVRLADGTVASDRRMRAELGPVGARRRATASRTSSSSRRE